MARRSLYLFLALCSAAYAQVPQNLVGTVSRSTQLATLKWDPVPLATDYSVYKTIASSYVCPAQADQRWVEVATGITATTYDDSNQITHPPLWCYAVTATVNGVESLFSAPVSVVTEAGYVEFSYADSCLAGASRDHIATAGSTAEFVQYRNGVRTVLPVNTQKTTGAVGWQFHIYDDATYTMKLIWNDGTIQGPFPLFESKVFPKSNIGIFPIHIIKIRGVNGAVCAYDELIREQKTTP